MELNYIVSTGRPDPRLGNVLTILLHGGASSSSMYQTLTPYLATQSIAVDLPGHGGSVQHGPFTFQKSTELLKSLINNLNSRPEYASHQIVLVGISLGGQAVLDFVVQNPDLVFTAIVSGATINPPDDVAQWEMPHMPTEQFWIDLMTKDIGIVGLNAANSLQKESFAFTLKGRLGAAQKFPPLLICIGENDTAMAKRDFPELVNVAKEMNSKSVGSIIEGAWHNHSIDIPEKFAATVNSWVEARVADRE